MADSRKGKAHFWLQMPVCSCVFGLLVLALKASCQGSFGFKNPINNIIVSKAGQVYVATANFLYLLNCTLALERTEDTLYNNTSFSTNVMNCFEKPVKENKSQILVVYEEKQQLIACWTLRFGACEIRDLGSGAVLPRGVDKVTVAAPHPRGSTAAVLLNLEDKTTYLAVAATYRGEKVKVSAGKCGFTPYSDEATFTIRNTEPELFGLLELGATPLIRLNDECGDRKKMLHFVEGFLWSGRINFLFYTTTSSSNLSIIDGPMIAQMEIKSSKSDTLASYGQVSLLCGEETPRRRLLSSTLLALPSGEELLAAVFSGEGRERRPDTSALCIFNLSRIRDLANEKDRLIELTELCKNKVSV
nr:PREDICTED: plexin-C1 [Latimeria chalumnae]|eukprot:XP_014350336.1 PREDICTED: plexin-C1 [Latimeria chalumnae]